MRKPLLSMLAFAALLTSCERDLHVPDNRPDQSIDVDMSDFRVQVESPEQQEGRWCATMDVLAENLREDPDLQNRMFQVEKHTRTQLEHNKTGKSDGLGIIDIPVVVHVIYRYNYQNISTAQIDSQIDVLNEDFNAANSDIGQVPGEFAGLVADADVNFNVTQVIRKYSSRRSWGTNDMMKYSYYGGSDAVSPETHLNIWICNIGGGILGYAQFPGGNPATDGVVISPQYFGTTGYVSAPFDKGRTATHEVGHWLNLRHIWGDGNCSYDDYVADTPVSDGPNYGCPNYPTTNCGSNDMTMNYMDYVDDACMYMFSEGQKTRMRAIFASGGPRESFVY